MGSAPVRRDPPSRVASSVRRGAMASAPGSYRIPGRSQGRRGSGGSPQPSGSTSGGSASGIIVTQAAPFTATEWIASGAPGSDLLWVTEGEWGSVAFDTTSNQASVGWTEPGTYAVTLNVFATVPAGETLLVSLGCGASEFGLADFDSYGEITVTDTPITLAVAGFVTGDLNGNPWSGGVGLGFNCSDPAQNSACDIYNMYLNIVRVG